MTDKPEGKVLQIVPDVNPKLSIWDRLETTDHRYTKAVSIGNYAFTSINGEYQIKRMTEIFGPCGVSWGYHIVESNLVDCGPCWRQWKADEQPFEDGRILLHTMRIMLWFVLPQDQGKPIDEQLFHKIPAIGHTPFRTQRLQKISGGTELYYGANVDFEYEKKSLTDAMTKAMASIGMAADVRMGMFDPTFDHGQYLAGRVDAVALEQAVDQTEEAVRQRHEFADWFKATCEVLRGSTNIRELELIYKPALERVKRQGTPEQLAAFETLKNELGKAIVAAARKPTPAPEPAPAPAPTTEPVVDTIREIRAEKPDTQPAQIPVADAAAALEAVGTETQKRTRQRRKLVRELGNEPDPAPAPTTEPAADNSPEIRPEKSTTPEPEPQPVPDEGKQDAPYITCQRCEERIYAPFTRPCTDPLCQHSSTPAPKPPSPSDLGALL